MVFAGIDTLRGTAAGTCCRCACGSTLLIADTPDAWK
jgi:hypothetical protein